MRIGLATPSWNTAEWIYPFLKLTEGLDKRVIVQGTKPIDVYKKEYGLLTEPDKSEALIRKYFPDVEIITHDTNEFGPSFWNKGHEYLARDCDFIFRFDTDEMLHPDFWKLILKTVHEREDLDALGIDFGKALMFGQDFKHGMQNPNNPWIETRGLNAKHRYSGFGAFTGPQIDIEPNIGDLYHFKGYKAGYKHESGTYKVPKWLVDLFEEGWEKLKTL